MCKREYAKEFESSYNMYLNFVKENNCTRILEIGGGISHLAYFLLREKNTIFKYDIIESNSDIIKLNNYLFKSDRVHYFCENIMNVKLFEEYELIIIENTLKYFDRIARIKLLNSIFKSLPHCTVIVCDISNVLDDIIDELNYMKENIMKLEKNHIVIRGGIFYEKIIYSY